MSAFVWGTGYAAVALALLVIGGRQGWDRDLAVMGALFWPIAAAPVAFLLIVAAGELVYDEASPSSPPREPESKP